jgi:hypothetical protein
METERPYLSIGMACHDDYDGVYFSLQALRLFHKEVMVRTELVVVDNSPNTKAGEAVREFVEVYAHFSNCGALYVPMPEQHGTSQPRNKIFEVARGEVVLVMDCHVLLEPGSVLKLVNFFESHPESQDLMQGPLVNDDLQRVFTHFEEEWRDRMLGTWATDNRGLDPRAAPFEIPAQGLGMFACRRETWLGFNEHFRGFGGEEFYIHAKYRQAGRTTFCLPFLRWVHRFGRPYGHNYPRMIQNKVRNYVIGFTELGLSLDPIHEHFVISGHVSQDAWERLLSDPTGAFDQEEDR